VLAPNSLLMTWIRVSITRGITTSILIHSLLCLLIVRSLFMCSLDHCSMYYNCSILYLASCVGEVCLDLFPWWVHWLFSLFSLLWTWLLFIWSWSKREKNVLYQCFGYDPCLLRHGVHFPCRHDFQLDGSTPTLRWVSLMVHIFLVVSFEWPRLVLRFV
jgi:hypothetical protein